MLSHAILVLRLPLDTELTNDITLISMFLLVIAFSARISNMFSKKGK
jgi:hypothetical protein